MDPTIESVLQDSQELLARALPAFEAQKKVAALEQTKSELQSKIASLSQEKTAIDGVIKTAAEKAASFFEARGMLKVSRDQFVQQLCENPSVIFDAVEGFVDSTTLKEAGVANGDQASTQELDPIEAFCFQ